MFTYSRHLFDSVFGRMGAAPSRGSPTGFNYGDGYGSAMEYDKFRKVFENATGTMTPLWFWRCPTCKHKGQLYRDKDQAVIDRHMANLDASGSQVTSQGGSIGPTNAPGANQNKD